MRYCLLCQDRIDVTAVAYRVTKVDKYHIVSNGSLQFWLCERHFNLVSGVLKASVSADDADGDVAEIGRRKGVNSAETMVAAGA